MLRGIAFGFVACLVAVALLTGDGQTTRYVASPEHAAAYEVAVAVAEANARLHGTLRLALVCGTAITVTALAARRPRRTLHLPPPTVVNRLEDWTE